MVRRIALGSGIAGVACVLCTLVACSSLPDLHFDDGDGGIVFGEGGLDGSFLDCRTTSGSFCQDAVPGWTPVLFAASGRATCPSGTSGIDLKVASGDASPTCACSCSSAGGSCTSGSFTVTSASDPVCAVTPTTTTVSVDTSGCTPLNGSIALSSHAMAKPPSGPTTCMPNGGQASTLSTGRLCQVTGDRAGCSATQSCAPKGNGELQSCVTKLGSNACPAGYSKRSTAGTDAVDHRTCTGCTCGAPTPCSGGSVSLYDSSMCKVVGMQHGAEGIGGACNSLSPDSGFTATHFRSTPPTGGGCGTPTSQGTAAGSVDFQNVRTVCCR